MEIPAKLRLFDRKRPELRCAEMLRLLPRRCFSAGSALAFELPRGAITQYETQGVIAINGMLDPAETQHVAQSLQTDDVL